MSKERGFSLIEISIVIIIVALITVGFLAVRSILDQAKIRTIISEYNKHDTAFNKFYEQFGAIPGDMPNAWDMWGERCASSESLCNGNGNLEIPHDYYEVDETYELIKAWKHLEISGLIKGNYTIEHRIDVIAGVHIPKSNFEKGGWHMNKYVWWAGNIDASIGIKHRFNIGSKRQDFLYHAPLFFAKDAYRIDKKVDDGLPYTGKVVSHGGYQEPLGVNPNCVDGSGTAAKYKIYHQSSPSCNIMIEATVFGGR